MPAYPPQPLLSPSCLPRGGPPWLARPRLAWAWRRLGVAATAGQQPVPALADGLAVERVGCQWGAGGSKQH
jgi:hypothetical protein